jgi:1-acyl-sn-glycerol-3-phosphate acyltransferase
MFYQFVKILARTAFKFYCRDLQLNKPEMLKSGGPLLLAANHPNSFLDAIILCTLFDKPVYSLARGDAFKGKFMARVLFSLKLLPVYRVSEGVENLEENYKTFDQCKEIFKNNGIVLIFSEGRCINEWHLRPLKKGTARLAISSWEDGIPLNILPVGINYSSFRKFGKNITLDFGEVITQEHIKPDNGYGRSIQQFNELLNRQLELFVLEINTSDKKKLKQHFYKKQPAFKKILLWVPSLLGWLFHAPLFIPVKHVVNNKLTSSDHYDSMMVALLFIGYPLYILLLTLLTFFITGHWYDFLLLACLPLTAWAHIQLKKQLD